MNEFGREALRAAGLAGVRQIFRKMRDPDGGRCALGVLHDAAGDELLEVCGLLSHPPTHACPLCKQLMPQSPLLAHLNDAHHADFLKIASLMPVTDAAL